MRDSLDMATALTVRKFLISETLAFIAFIPSSLYPLNPLQHPLPNFPLLSANIRFSS